MALASLICGILGISVVGLPLGLIARRKIGRSSGQVKGKGLATAGIIVSAVILIAQCFVLISFYSNLDTTDKARVATTKFTLKELHMAVVKFRLDTGRFPTEEEGLLALVEAPEDTEGWRGYLEDNEVPKDAWNRNLVYMLRPGSGEPFAIFSYGADGKEGGRGINRDLISTELYQKEN